MEGAREEKTGIESEEERESWGQEWRPMWKEEERQLTGRGREREKRWKAMEEQSWWASGVALESEEVRFF